MSTTPTPPAALTAQPCPPMDAMSDDEKTILSLTREKQNLQSKLDEAKKELLHVGMALSRAGVPNGFEDGNSYDSYSESERANILADSYERLKKEKSQ